MQRKSIPSGPDELDSLSLDYASCRFTNHMLVPIHDNMLALLFDAPRVKESSVGWRSCVP